MPTTGLSYSCTFDGRGLPSKIANAPSEGETLGVTYDARARVGQGTIGTVSCDSDVCHVRVVQKTAGENVAKRSLFRGMMMQVMYFLARGAGCKILLGRTNNRYRPKDVLARLAICLEKVGKR